jgi:hypothetical protein
MSAAAADVVGVFDENMAQAFPLARPGKAAVTESATLAEHPVESGGVIVDNRVIEPTEIELYLYVTRYEETYPEIREAFLGQKLLTVQTRTGIYENMAITEMPHEEAPDMEGAIVLSLSLREIRLVEATFQTLPPKKVKKKNDASTVDRGEQKPKEEKPKEEEKPDTLLKLAFNPSEKSE